MDDFLAAERSDIDLTVETNVTAFLHALRAVLPGMRARRRGHVVNIGSVAGLYAIRSPIYGASKGAVRRASQNLRLDLAGSGGARHRNLSGPRRHRVPGVGSGRGGSAAHLWRVRRTIAAGHRDAIVYAVGAPWRVNVSTIEIVPTEQAFGGVRNTPVER